MSLPKSHWQLLAGHNNLWDPTVQQQLVCGFVYTEAPIVVLTDGNIDGGGLRLSVAFSSLTFVVGAFHQASALDVSAEGTQG